VKKHPYLIQYFVNGLGRDAASCSDLMSYLLFTPEYPRPLSTLGTAMRTRELARSKIYIFFGRRDSELAAVQ